MAFKRVPQKFNSAIGEVTFGVGDKAVTIGGNCTFPMYNFDAEAKNRPALGLEITDKGVDTSLPGIAEAFAVCETLAQIAAKASSIPGVDFLALYLESSDPNGADMSVEDCVAVCKEVADNTDLPLVIEGSKNADKDKAVFNAVAQALEGKNALFMSAREDNYKNLSASVGQAYNQKLAGESAVDINLAKQLNVMISQAGLGLNNVVMHLGSAAAGYGFEYVVSTMDRVRAAALAQDDKMLQLPIITPVGNDAWSVKEALVSEEDFPEWGPVEDRGVQMEVTTAASCLAAGSDAVILKHPKSIAALAEIVAALN